MTRDELRQLRRASLLALKAFFAMSVDKDLFQAGNMFQLESAARLHEACCRELEAPPRRTHLSFIAETVLEELIGEAEQGSKNGRVVGVVLTDVLQELRNLLDMNNGVEDDQGEQKEGGGA
jgi:hypothetical protein